MSIACGYCHNRHASIAEVKTCSAAPAVKPSIFEAFAPVEALPTPVQSTTRCQRCAGTGQFITGTENGKPTGPGGICFRCEGKGVQTDCGAAHHLLVDAAVKARTRDAGACCDTTRNDLYDTHYMSVGWAR